MLAIRITRPPTRLLVQHNDPPKNVINGSPSTIGSLCLRGEVLRESATTIPEIIVTVKQAINFQTFKRSCLMVPFGLVPVADCGFSVVTECGSLDALNIVEEMRGENITSRTLAAPTRRTQCQGCRLRCEYHFPTQSEYNPLRSMASRGTSSG